MVEPHSMTYYLAWIAKSFIGFHEGIVKLGVLS